jgi:TDG/mug DNA glycosylase family protein
MPLRDRIEPGVRVLFVGINPGMRSEAIGHHFAGYSNRFWKLLYQARLVTEPIGTEDDGRLPDWKLGITNLVPRATPGMDTIRPAEYIAGLQALRRKVRRFRPAVVAFVGVSVRLHEEGPRGAGAAGRDLRGRAGLRPAEPERPERELHLSRDARRLPAIEARPPGNT